MIKTEMNNIFAGLNLGEVQEKKQKRKKKKWVCYIKLGSDTGQRIGPNTVNGK